MILVVGATGTNGREVVDRLVALGIPVRALVRNPAKAADLRDKNVELVQGDLDTPSSLDAALTGAERVFFVSAVDQRHVGWFRNFLESAQRVAPKTHVVKFSAMGADHDSPVEIFQQHGETDRMLVESGLTFTILRPNSFHQNLFTAAGAIKDYSAFYLPMGDATVSLVDVRDIADVAVEILSKGGHEGQTYEITGPESISFHDVAAAFSKALGKPVQYVPVPSEAALDSMLKAGMPEWNAKAVVDLFGLFARGEAARTTDTVEKITGKRPIAFEEFAQDYADAFR